MEPHLERRTIARNVMHPGESILWTGKPDPRRTIVRAVPPALFGCLLAGFGLFWTQSAAAAMLDVSYPSSLFPLLGLIPAAVGARLLLSPLVEYLLARRTVYAITGQRVLIIRGGRFRTISYARAGIAGTNRTDLADGSGDITFFQPVPRKRAPGPRARRVRDRVSVLPPGFYGIPNVRAVERILRP